MRTVDKPWGKEEIWAETDRYLGKFLYINAGEMLSRQYHVVKDETILVMEGPLRLEIGEPDTDSYNVFELGVGMSYHITPNTVHRFCANEGTPVKLAEVSTPEIDDVVRLEDKYKR